MLNIVVLGEAVMIPRGYGIAPRKDPFKADLKLISLILKTGGLEPYFINPDTGVKTRLTMENYERMYATYGTEKKAAQVVAPKVEAPKQVVQQPVQQNKPAEQPKPAVEEKKEEEKKEENMSITPVANPNSNNNGNNNKHNNKH